MEKLNGNITDVVEQSKDKDRKPTPKDLDGYKVRSSSIRTRLEQVGLIPSDGASTGAKLGKYFARTAKVESPLDMTVTQWEAVFTGLDTLMNDPKRAMEVVNEVGGYAIPTAEEIEAAKTRPTTSCSVEGCLDPATWAYPHDGPLCKTHAAEAHERWLEQRKQEQAGPHGQRIRELTRSFFQQIEAEGYQGYAIIAVPNGVMRGSKLDSHLENCEECSDDGDWCDDAHSALFEDESHDNVFVFETAGVGEPGDYSGLAFELSDEGRSRVDDLISDAETVTAQTDAPIQSR
jgi:hypothetical protein